jgi:hypothetical protein
MNRKIPERLRALIFSLCFIFLALGNITALGQTEAKDTENSPPEYPKGKITISGRVRLVGSASFSRLVITDEKDRNWYVEGEDREKLSRMEQRTVKVKGTTEYQDIILANGENVGIRRFLRKITIIE